MRKKTPYIKIGNTKPGVQESKIVRFVLVRVIALLSLLSVRATLDNYVCLCLYVAVVQDNIMGFHVFESKHVLAFTLPVW